MINRFDYTTDVNAMWDNILNELAYNYLILDNVYKVMAYEELIIFMQSGLGQWPAPLPL